MKNIKLVLEYDDFHWDKPENCLDIIERFVSVVPNIKLTMFTVPNLRGNLLFQNPEWCKRVAELCNQGVLEISRHGWTHAPLEYEHCNFDYAMNSLLLGDKVLDSAGIPYARVFRGPYWGLNHETVRALNELGYTHLYNHIDHSSIGHDFRNKVVFYNWNLGLEPPEFKLLIGHGHTHNVCGNGIEETFERVINFIDINSPEFLFSSEV